MRRWNVSCTRWLEREREKRPEPGKDTPDCCDKPLRTRCDNVWSEAGLPLADSGWEATIGQRGAGAPLTHCDSFSVMLSIFFFISQNIYLQVA
jgi:hypothetical protein